MSRTIEALGPARAASIFVYELRFDAQLIAGPPHAPGDDRVHMQRRRGLAGIDVPSFICERRRARRHAQPVGSREIAHELLGHAVAEILAGGVAAQILEGQHRNRGRQRLAPGASDAPADQRGDDEDDRDGCEQWRAT